LTMTRWTHSNVVTTDVIFLSTGHRDRSCLENAHSTCEPHAHTQDCTAHVNVLCTCEPHAHTQDCTAHMNVLCTCCRSHTTVAYDREADFTVCDLCFISSTSSSNVPGVKGIVIIEIQKMLSSPYLNYIPT
jgi:hypothetical protein